MTKPLSDRARPATLSLSLGNWFQAHATGWGVAAVPLVVLMVLGLAVLQLLIR